MIRMLLCILLLTLPPAPRYDTITLILVEPSRQSASPAALADSYRAVHEATAFWGELSPITTTLTISDAGVLAIDGDGSSMAWLEPWLNPAAASQGITLFVLDSPYLLPGNDLGLAYQRYGVVVVSRGASQNLAATIAHELGHALYGLPDRYGHGPCQIDIMCNPAASWEAHTLGCPTMEQLGGHCWRQWFPLFVT